MLQLSYLNKDIKINLAHLGITVGVKLTRAHSI